MAELMFTSETGMFHSACCCKLGSSVEWYGFKPVKHRAPIGSGLVDHSDRSALVNHSITFEIDDAVLRSGIQKVSVQYSIKTYAATVCDCVSFTADVARRVGLRVPAVNMTPYGFIECLALWNSYKAKT